MELESSELGLDASNAPRWRNLYVSPKGSFVAEIDHATEVAAKDRAAEFMAAWRDYDNLGGAVISVALPHGLRLYFEDVVCVVQIYAEPLIPLPVLRPVLAVSPRPIDDHPGS